MQQYYYIRTCSSYPPVNFSFGSLMNRELPDAPHVKSSTNTDRSDVTRADLSLSPYGKCLSDQTVERGQTKPRVLPRARELRSLAARVFQFAPNGSVARKIRDCRDLLSMPLRHYRPRWLAMALGFNPGFNFQANRTKYGCFFERGRGESNDTARMFFARMCVYRRDFPGLIPER